MGFSVLNMGNTWDYARLPLRWGLTFLFFTMVVEGLLFHFAFRNNKQSFEIKAMVIIANIVTFLIGFCVGVFL